MHLCELPLRHIAIAKVDEREKKIKLFHVVFFFYFAVLVAANLRVNFVLPRVYTKAHAIVYEFQKVCFEQIFFNCIV